MQKGRDSGNKDKHEQALWDSVTRSVKAYKKQAPPAASKTERSIRKIKPASRAAAALPPAGGPAKAPPKGFDRSTETKLKRGQLPLEGRIDLHGLSQAKAYVALRAFLFDAVMQRKRTVLVITGKGRRSEGVLRQKLPQWLAEPDIAPHVIAVTPARPQDGGTGAFYLRLRKPK